MVRRQPGFMNQLEKRIQRRLGNIKPMPEPRPPSNVSFPHGDKITITIPSDQEILEQSRIFRLKRKHKDDREQPKNGLL